MENLDLSPTFEKKNVKKKLFFLRKEILEVVIQILEVED